MGVYVAVLGALACVGVLWAESRRLPGQNVVALAVIAPLAAAGLDWVVALAEPGFGPTWASVAWGAWSMLAGRAIARLPGPGPSHLFVRTAIATLVLSAAVHWTDTGSGRPLSPGFPLRLALDPIALLLLFPWWIAKPLLPRTIPARFNLLLPAALAGHALLDLAAAGLSGVVPRGVAAIAVAIWVFRFGR